MGVASWDKGSRVRSMPDRFRLQCTAMAGQVAALPIFHHHSQPLVHCALGRPTYFLGVAVTPWEALPRPCWPLLARPAPCCGLRCQLGPGAACAPRPAGGRWLCVALC